MIHQRAQRLALARPVRPGRGKLPNSATSLALARPVRQVRQFPFGIREQAVERHGERALHRVER